jgi:death-on-curing protein
MIVWLDKRLVLALHDRQLAEHGGSPGVRDDNLLESALARPQQLHACGDPPPDLADLAATLALGLARNHPFVDGNKRTAHVSYRAFLALNGVEFPGKADEKFVTILALAEGKMTVEEFAGWLRAQIPPSNRGEVHERRPAYKRRRRAA